MFDECKRKEKNIKAEKGEKEKEKNRKRKTERTGKKGKEKQQEKQSLTIDYKNTVSETHSELRDSHFPLIKLTL